MENGRIHGLGWESCVLLLPLVTTGSHDCALPAAAISSSFPWGLSQPGSYGLFSLPPPNSGLRLHRPFTESQ